MAVEPLTPELARNLGLTKHSEGVVVREIAPDGPAATAALQPGDVIVQVNGHAVKSPSELKAALDKTADRPALLLVARRNVELFLTIKRNS
jgi:serine protease Do